MIFPLFLKHSCNLRIPYSTAMGRSFLLARRGDGEAVKRELRVERDARHVGAQGERRPG